jgi:hAT family C-terminal dimerisation region
MASDAMSIESSPAPSTITAISQLTSNISFDGPQSKSASDIARIDKETIHHKGIVYRRGLAIPAKTKSRKNWVWTMGEEVYCDKDSKSYWLCTICLDLKCFKTFATTSTHWIENHLEKKHSITETGPVDSIELTNSADPTDSSKYVSLIDFSRLRQRFIEWIVLMHITFSQVESMQFRRFLEVLSPRLASWIPSSGNTVRNWIITEFKQKQKQIKAQLDSSKSSIHLTFDLWTSPNHLSIVGVHGHFINSQYKVDNVMLGLRRLQGPHSGENIAEAVMSIIKTYGISDRIGYFVLDNATSNTTCVTNILDALEVDDITKNRRLCCLAHVINLSAKAFLFGKDPDAFEKEVRDCNDDIKERDSWRQRGPIGKLHNIVVYIRRTPQRREDFEEKVKDKLKEFQEALTATIQSDEDPDDVLKLPLMVVQDNSTRWNSVYAMIQRALLLRDPIDLFVKRAMEKPQKDSPLPRDDELSSHDWDILSETAELLKPFYDQSIRIQSRALEARNGSLWETIPTIEFLLNRLEAQMVRYGSEINKSQRKISRRAPKQTDTDNPDHEQLLICIRNAWAKLDEYYQRMNDSPAYIASVIINPLHKWYWFDIHWKAKPQWIKEAREAARDLWIEKYKDIATFQNEPSILSSAPGEDPSDFDQFMAPPDYYKPDEHSVDEYEQYCTEPRQDKKSAKKFNLCSFWASHENTSPSLARMAFDMLSIPATSAECERTFSSAKLLLTDQRSRLKADIIEASECLRAWVAADR